jgi:hypothetical protein
MKNDSRIEPAIEEDEFAFATKGKNGPAQPVLILPSPYTRVIDCAAECFKGWAKRKTHFVRNGEFVVPEETKNGISLRPLLPAEFASEIERPFELQVYGKNRQGELELKPTRCGERNAKLLLLTEEMREYGLPLSLVAASSVLVERDGRPVVLQKGYHADAGGIYVAKNMDIPDIPLDEAVRILTGLFADYKWVSPSDLSRAVAQIISPALKLGNHLPGADFPLDLGLGNESQAGKTHRCKFTAALYGEQAYPVISQTGGVGSFDEKLGTALCSGKLFVTMDNLRGDVNSPLLESTLRGLGAISVRMPYRSTILIQTDQVLIQLTSNNANLTKDLTNRSIITNNQKQPKNYTPKLPWGEDFIQHIKSDQAIYLGCIHEVIRHWISKGKPRTKENRHAFSAWVQSHDWIVQNIFNLPPLMDDHASPFVSDITLSWFRSVVLGVVKSNQNLPVTIQTTEICDICDIHTISIPGLRPDANDESRVQFVGRLLAKVFKESDTVAVEGYEVIRTISKATYQQHHDIKKYIFRIPIKSLLKR